MFKVICALRGGFWFRVATHATKDKAEKDAASRRSGRGMWFFVVPANLKRRPKPVPSQIAASSYCPERG